MIIRTARPDDAAAIVDLIHRAFAARPALDPPSSASEETETSVRAVIESTGAYVAESDGVIIGSVLLDRSRDNSIGLRRVSVDPDAQKSGIASLLIREVELSSDVDGMWLTAREELPQTVNFWLRRGYSIRKIDSPLIELAKPAGIRLNVSELSETKAFASRLARLLKPGDVVILSGDLGAGKTTFTQSLGEALGVRGPITSPTFVIARMHPSLIGGPSLVHVDAYRLGSAHELIDLDLDAWIDHAVTVVEWGEGKAEQLSDSWLHINFHANDQRIATVDTYGPRWLSVPLRSELSH